MKNTAVVILAVLGLAVLAGIEGEYNTWLGYLAGDSADGNRVTVQGAGAGGGASGLVRTDLVGAAAGVYSYGLIDTVGIGYRALRYSQNMSNCVAIGSHALENVDMGCISGATWINGHFVANPPEYDDGTWKQTPGEIYITGDATLTNNLAPIWYDGTNLHLRGYSPGIETNSVAPPDGNTYRAETYGTDKRWTDAEGCVWEVVTPEDWTLNVTLGPGAGHTNYTAVTRYPFWDDGSYYGGGWVFELGGPNSFSTTDPYATVLTYTNFYYHVVGGEQGYDDQYEVIYTFTRSVVTNSVTNLVGHVALAENVIRTNSLAGQTFDLSTNGGMLSAVSNLIIRLGGSVGAIP